MIRVQIFNKVNKGLIKGESKQKKSVLICTLKTYKKHLGKTTSRANCPIKRNTVLYFHKN